MVCTQAANARRSQCLLDPGTILLQTAELMLRRLYSHVANLATRRKRSRHSTALLWLGLAEPPVVALTLAFRVRWQKWNMFHCIPEQGAQY